MKRISALKKYCICLFLGGSIFVISAAAVANESATGGTISEEKKQEALAHFQKGQARFSQGEFLLAVEHFKLSYEITGSPEILYNIAMCYEEENDKEQAIAHYQMYLQVSAGDDTEEVKKKIDALGGSVRDDTQDGDDEEDADGEDDGFKDTSGSQQKYRRLDRVALEVALGPAFVIKTPDTGVTARGTSESAKRNYFSMDFLLHFYLNDWFAITGVFLVGPYMEGNTQFISRDPTSHVGAGIGVAMKKDLGKRASLLTNILAIPCAIKRQSMTKRAAWFAFDIRVGMNIRLSHKLEVNLVAVAEGGPAIIVKRDGPSDNDWQNGLLFSVGPRLGITYTF